MKRTMHATALVLLMVCAGLSEVCLAYQSKHDDAHKTMPPAVPTAKPNPAIKGTLPIQNKGGSAAQIDPERQARFNEAQARLAIAIKPSKEKLRQAYTLYQSGDLVGAESAAQDTIVQTARLSPAAQSEARLLIGQIRIKQERYQEALDYFIPAGQSAWHAGLNLDVALCYARLGNTKTAKQLYSDQALLQYSSIQPQDLPGTHTPQTLEASILLARGMDKFFSATGEKEALDNFNAALKLVPKNGLAAYYAGKSLNHMGRYAEAGPYFVRAAQNGRGKIAEKAKGYAATYLRNKEKQKNALQNATQQTSP